MNEQLSAKRQYDAAVRANGCSNCGYDLSGLGSPAERVRCPECGQRGPVGAKVKAPWLAVVLAVAAGFMVMTVAVCVVMSVDRFSCVPLLYIGAVIGATATALVARVADRRPRLVFGRKCLFLALSLGVVVAVVNLLTAKFFVMVLEAIHG